MRTIAGELPRRFLLVAGGLVAAVFLLGVLLIYRSPQWSAIDEATHIDYAWSIAHGQVPRGGSTLHPDVLQAWACTGQQNVTLPACDSGAPASTYPGAGENYNFGTTPLYYAVTGVLGRLVSAVLPGVGFVVAARLMSLCWVAAGIVLLYYALRSWGVRWPVAAAGSLFALVFPTVLAAGTTVNPDAAAIVCGALALLLLRRVLTSGRGQVVLSIVLAALAASTKVMNALVFLAAAVVILVYALRNKIPGVSRLRGVVTAGGMVAAVLAVWVGWTEIQKLRTVPGWTNPILGVNTDPVRGSPLGEWLGTLFSGLDVTQGYYFSAPVNTWTIDLWRTVLSPVVVAIAVAGVALLSGQRGRSAVAWVTLVGLLAWPTVVQLQTYFGTPPGYYFPAITGRYGISMVPAIAGVAAMASDRKRLAWVLGGLCLAGYLLLLSAVFGVPTSEP